jgi:hypothetical protein
MPLRYYQDKAKEAAKLRAISFKTRGVNKNAW